MKTSSWSFSHIESRPRWYHAPGDGCSWPSPGDPWCPPGHIITGGPGSGPWSRGQGRHNVFTQVHSSSLLHFTSFTPRSLRTENVWIWWNVSLFKTFINFWKELPRVKCKFSLFYHSKLLLNCYLKWEMMHINIFLVPQTSSYRGIGERLLPESIEVELNLPLKIQFRAEANNGLRKFK